MGFLVFVKKNIFFLHIVSIVSINQFLHGQQIFLIQKKIPFYCFRNLCFSKHFLLSRPPFYSFICYRHPFRFSSFHIIQSNKNKNEKNLSSSFPPTQNLDFYASLFLVIYHCTIRNWIYGHHVCYGYFCYELKKQSGEDHYLEQRKSFQTFRAIPR